MPTEEQSPQAGRGLGLGDIGSLLSPELKDDPSKRLLSPSFAYTPFEQSPSLPCLSNPNTEPLTWQSPASTLTCDGRYCRSSRQIRQPGRRCGNIALLLLAVYSMLLSGVWLGLALAKPHYRNFIRNGGPLAPVTASILIAAFAKSIELAFVCVFIAFIGQSLSRKALNSISNGISISDMMLRTLVLQPGALITHLSSFSNVWRSSLGIMAIVATLSATFFTTASDALVSPKPVRSNPVQMTLQSETKTSFANENFVEAQCRTPVSNKDPVAGNSTCINIEHAGQAFHNFMQFLDNWNEAIDQNNVFVEEDSRPLPVATLYDNTTVTGSWINQVDMHDTSLKFGRVVDNRTMALPHTGIPEVLWLPDNSLFSQPESDGFGEITLDASVLTPTVNVLCASASQEELDPLVWDSWQADNHIDTSKIWPDDYSLPKNFQNRTDLDPIFGFGAPHPPPIFPVFPQEYNTVLNGNGNDQWDTIYLLATSSSSDSYMLCSLSITLEPGCSTSLTNTYRGGSLSTNCAKGNPMAHPGTATSGKRLRGWVGVANSWALGVALNGGIVNASAANARLLTQMIPQDITPSKTSPTLSEGLCVLAGCTILISGINAPLTGTFDFPREAYDNRSILNTPKLQPFTAMVTMRDYASGPQQQWQYVFYLVLFSVFLLSTACVFYFGYLIRASDIVTDFIEPQNLFALALNSPGSAQLAGACGAGPEGSQQMHSKWFIRTDEHDHVFLADTDRVHTQAMGSNGGGNGGRYQGYRGVGSIGRFDSGDEMPKMVTPHGFGEQFEMEEGRKGKLAGLSPALKNPGLMNPELYRRAYAKLRSGLGRTRNDRQERLEH